MNIIQAGFVSVFHYYSFLLILKEIKTFWGGSPENGCWALYFLYSMDQLALWPPPVSSALMAEPLPLPGRTPGICHRLAMDY